MNQTNIDDMRAGSGQDRKQRARQSSSDAQRRFELGRWREVGQNLSTQIDEQIHKRPYVAVGAAAGVGFVAGSLFGSRLGQVLVAVGFGYFAKTLLGDAASLEAIQAGLEKMTGETGAID
jgi:ElaB/YqjD/DUF883 family membrane-anchored ribosome-binding protein